MQIHLLLATILQPLSSSSPFPFSIYDLFQPLIFPFLIPLGRLHISLLPPKSPTWRETKGQGAGRGGRRERGSVLACAGEAEAVDRSSITVWFMNLLVGRSKAVVSIITFSNYYSFYHYYYLSCDLLSASVDRMKVSVSATNTTKRRQRRVVRERFPSFDQLRRRRSKNLISCPETKQVTQNENRGKIWPLRLLFPDWRSIFCSALIE